MRRRVNPIGAQRTPSAARLRELWDMRLRVSEREYVIERAGMSPALAELRWGELQPDQVQRVVITLRDLEQLGVEAAYALGYTKRNR